MIVPNVFANPPSNRSNIYERDWSNFDQVHFVLDYFSIDWDDTLKISDENIDYQNHRHFFIILYLKKFLTN